MSRPLQPFRCRSCGELDEAQFSAGYKSLCSGCRRYNERLRYWQQRGRYTQRERA